MIKIDYNQIQNVQVTGCGKVQEGFTDGVGFARVAMVPGLSAAAFHKVTTEYYLILNGQGLLRTESENGKQTETQLIPGVVVKIEPNEIHQVNNLDSLVLEAITYPAWKEEDEIPANKDLF
jgi:mannose-6-phosphate isomerase-like protein (cupin superfamily)